MKKNKKIIIISSIVIVAVLAIIICIMSFSKKKTTKENKNEDYSVTLTNQLSKNEDIEISIDNLAYADKYLIIDYTVKSKNEDEAFFSENYARKNEFGFYLDRKITIDGNSVEIKDDYSDQISYKISDTEAKVYDILEIEDLPEKFNLEVTIFENDLTVIDDEEIDEEIEEETSGEEDADEQDDEKDEELVENIDPDEYENSSDERESVLTDEEYEEFKDEYTEDEDEDEIEEDTEEIYEEVEGYYDGTDEEDDEDEDETEFEIMAKEIGKITTKASKEELTKEVTVEDLNEEYTENNVTIKNQKVIKTPFKTFVIVDSTITEIRYEDVQTDTLGDPFLYKIDIEDEDGNSINSNEIQQINITDEDETDIADLEIGENNIPENLIATIKTIIILSDDTKEEIKLQPYYYSYDFPNDDDIEGAMENRDWFKIEDDEYTEVNSNGGEITITKIEEENNQILFHFTKKGFVPNAESIVLLRNSKKEFNVLYPDIAKLKGINSDENIVGYNMRNNTSYSYTNDSEENELENIEDLEFTLLEGLEIQKIGEGFTIKL